MGFFFIAFFGDIHITIQDPDFNCCIVITVKGFTAPACAVNGYSVSKEKEVLVPKAEKTGFKCINLTM